MSGSIDYNNGKKVYGNKKLARHGRLAIHNLKKTMETCIAEENKDVWMRIHYYGTHRDSKVCRPMNPPSSSGTSLVESLHKLQQAKNQTMRG